MNNSTVFNSSNDSRDDQYGVFSNNYPITLPLSIIAGMGIAIACASGLLNYFVFMALTRVSHSTLRPKSFIQNNAVANVILPIIRAIDVPMITSALTRADFDISRCYLAIYSNIEYVCFFVQVGCGLCLACDRIYAIAAPLSYYTVGYKTRARIMITMAPWAVALGIWLAFLSISIVTTPAIYDDMVCHIFDVTDIMMFSTGMLTIYPMATSGLSFLIYIGIFIGVNCQRARIKKSTSSSLKRASLSLVISYFIMNTTTLGLYLPLPIYASMQDGSNFTFADQQAAEITIRCLIGLYSCNCVLDPLIMLYRIRSIRQNVPFDFPACYLKRKSGNSYKRRNATQETDTGFNQKSP